MSGMDYLKALVDWFGPAGAAFAVVAGVVGYFYRRDVLRRVEGERGMKERLLVAFEKNAVAYERLAVTLSAFGDRLEDHERKEEQMVDAIGQKVEHAINGGFHTVLLELRAQGR